MNTCSLSKFSVTCWDSYWNNVFLQGPLRGKPHMKLWFFFQFLWNILKNMRVMTVKRQTQTSGTGIPMNAMAHSLILSGKWSPEAQQSMSPQIGTESVMVLGRAPNVDPSLTAFLLPLLPLTFASALLHRGSSSDNEELNARCDYLIITFLNFLKSRVCLLCNNPINLFNQQ